MPADKQQLETPHHFDSAKVVLESGDSRIALHGLHTKKPLLVIMLRHTGCPVCREHLLVTEKMIEQVRATNTEVIGVAQNSGVEAHELAVEMNISFDVLGDPSASLYKALNMPRGSWWQVTFGPMLKHPIKAMARMKHVKKPGKDIHQLGGVVLLDTNGDVAYRYEQKDSGDLPPEKEVIAALKALHQRNA